MANLASISRGLAAVAVLTAATAISFDTSLAASAYRTRAVTAADAQTADMQAVEPQPFDEPAIGVNYGYGGGLAAFDRAYDLIGQDDWHCFLSPGSLQFEPCWSNN
jgi:hypothetical protein